MMMQESKSDLNTVKQQFILWRKERRNQRAVIPENLWQEAVSLCSTYSVGEVRKELGLDHSALKSRIVAPMDQCAQSGFVSLDFSQPRSDAAIYEWERADGAKLRVKLAGSELARVLSCFFGDQ